MNNLTYKWKKGELPEGWYYGKTDNGIEILRTWNGIDGYINLENQYSQVYIGRMDDCEVLAPVPSYNEWFQIKNYASLSKCLQEKNIECLHRENEAKDLLKECFEYIDWTDGTGSPISQQKLLDKIDEVLK